MPDTQHAQRPPIERVAVLIPTYNERDNLPLIVDRLRRAVPTADVVVLDDNSPDGTGDVADAMAAADPQVKVLHRKGKEGLGRAYLAGFEWALAQGYDAGAHTGSIGTFSLVPQVVDAVKVPVLNVGAADDRLRIAEAVTQFRRGAPMLAAE